MSSQKFRWVKLPGPVLARSSHSLSVVGQYSYLFGGEIKPRQPCDNAMHKVALEGGQYEQITGLGDVPPPRVGHTASVIDDQIYIFGGRGGPDMTPLAEKGGVYAFCPSNSTWSYLESSSDLYPEPRSYHCATSTSTHLIIHAGCGAASGSRFADVWAFDVKTHQWTRLADAPGDPRGGSSICYDSGKIWRFGGYNGKTEIGGAIDSLELPSSSVGMVSTKWETRKFSPVETANSQCSDQDSGPGPRSVCALLPLPSQKRLVIFLGEGNPSPTGGHDAAGHFWGDLWTYDPSTNNWRREKIVQVSGGPGERGWFAAATSQLGPVLWGGIDGQNDRMTDGWCLTAQGTNSMADS